MKMFMGECRNPPVLESNKAPQPWYVVHCKPKSEQIALANLARQGFICYLPLLKVYAPRKASQVRLEVMFPRYLFCQPAHPEQSIAPIRSTQGVLTLVRFGSQPAVLGADIIDGIRRLEAHEHTRDAGDLSGLKQGDAIRVVSGSLSSLEGLVHQVSDQRVAILLELLGQPLKINLKLSEIAKI